MAIYIVDKEAAKWGIDMEHLDGVSWDDAPRPRRFHKHWAQTRGWSGLDLIERCPCGALRAPRFGRKWIKR